MGIALGRISSFERNSPIDRVSNPPEDLHRLLLEGYGNSLIGWLFFWFSVVLFVSSDFVIL